ncbi:MAG: hypothetical protein ACW98F_05810 [Candidatus Hodarchaeales archaeon]|jgi:hypothetical protein
MNQKYFLSGIIILGLLAWGSALLTATGNMGIIPIFESGNDAEHHEMHDTNHNDDSGHHGMMDGHNHATDECEEYDYHVEEGYDCDNYGNEDYCNQTHNGC